MILSEDQVKQYKQQGYLTIERFFDQEELAVIHKEVARLSQLKSPAHIYEKDGTLRAMMGPHRVSSLFHKLSTLKNIVVPSWQILKDNHIYIHQTKINHKRSLSGDRWDWHQDALYWKELDGLNGMTTVNVGIFLEAVNHESGPLMVIPGSHREGLVKLPVHEAYENANDWRSSFSSNLTYKLDSNRLGDILNNRSVHSLTGGPGMLVFFSPLIFHGSNLNMSHHDRTAIYMTYNCLSNQPNPKNQSRPDFIAERDFSVITEWYESLAADHPQKADVPELAKAH